MGHVEEIKDLLENFLTWNEILACMVAKKGGEGIIPDTSNFSSEIFSLWDKLQSVIDYEFNIIEEFHEYGLGEIIFRLYDYEVYHYVIEGSDTALIAVTHRNANRGIIEVELESMRDKITDIMNKKE